MSDVDVGKIITGPAMRDAIHIAIAPCIASEKLYRGDHVGLDSLGMAVSTDGNISTDPKPIGIVDPYLTGSVVKGQKFWLFLYPKTIKGLRHHWSHPSFPDADKEKAQLKTDSHYWIEDFAKEHGYTMDAVMEGAERYLKDGTCMDDNHSGFTVPDAFWGHFEAVTGKKLGNREPHFFTCCPEIS